MAIPTTCPSHRYPGSSTCSRGSPSRGLREPASFSPYSLDLLADDGTLYDDAGPACGTLLDGLDATEVPDGEKATGTVCWKLASADVRKVLMFYTDPFSGESIYFSLGL